MRIFLTTFSLESNVNKILKWFSTPTSKAGEVAILAALGAVAAGTVTLVHALPAIAYGIALMAIPDNTVAAKDVQAIVTDAINFVAAEKAVAPAVNAAVGAVTVPTSQTKDA